MLALADETLPDEAAVTVFARMNLNLPTEPGVKPRSSLIRSRAELDKVLGEELARQIDRRLGQPRIDFTRSMVACVSGGPQSTSGYRVEVKSLRRQTTGAKPRIIIRWSLRSPKGVVLQVLTTPLEVLLLERTEGEPVFETIDRPDTPEDRARPDAMNAEGWRALGALYQSLDLPQPAADQPLVAFLAEMAVVDVRDVTIPLHRPRFLLGFLIPATGTDPKARLLIGTEFVELEPEHVETLIRIDPDQELPDEILMQNAWADFDMNAGLPTAIQCFRRGWTALADRLLKMQAQVRGGFGHPASVFYQPPGLSPHVALKYVAWASCGNSLAMPTSDRGAILSRLRLLSQDEPSLQTPECWGLIQALAATLEPCTSLAGSPERHIDDLRDQHDGLWDGVYLLGLPKPLQMLAQQGLDVVPMLMRHADDRRLTRGVAHASGDEPPRLLSVGMSVGILLQQLAGDRGADWTRDPDGLLLEPGPVAGWWRETQKQSEPDYLVASAVPHLPQVTRPYVAIVRRLQERYPQRLPEVYRRLLTERPDVSGRDLLQAMLSEQLPHRDKMDTFLQGVSHPRLARQAEALEALATLDERVFESFLIKSLNALPATTTGRFADCEQVDIARLCWKTNSLNVWHPLRDAMRNADLGVRMEILDRIGDNPDLSSVRQMRVAELLLAFLNDASIRDISTAPERYAGCAAAQWPRIEVRNWAAWRLAARLKLDVSGYSPDASLTDADWGRLRDQVARVCEDRHISIEDPSPDEERQARQALQALGAIVLESAPREERRFLHVDLAQCRIVDADLRHIRFLEDVETLDLSGTPISDAGLRELRKCIRLRVLLLSGTRITNDGLVHLADLRGLLRLDLSQTAITDRGIPHLAGLIHLQQLSLDDTRVSDMGLTGLPGLLSLEILSLTGTAVTDAGLGHLSVIPRLANLDLAGTVITDAGLRAVGKCESLEALTLSLTKVTDAGLPSLAPLSRLQRLYLFGLPITDQGAAVLGRFPRLTTLSLTSDQITDTGVKSLTQLSELEVLSLQQSTLTDRGIEDLTRLTKLARLDLSGTNVTDHVINSLKRMDRLERVILSGTKVTAAARQDLQHARPALVIVE